MSKTLQFITFLFLIGHTLRCSPDARKELEAKLSVTSSEIQKAKLYLNYVRSHLSDPYHINLDYCTKALSICKKYKNAIYIGYAYETLGYLNLYATKNNLAIKYYILQMKLADSTSNIPLKASALMNIGNIKCILQKNRNESAYLYNALKFFSTLKDTNNLINTYDLLSCFYINAPKNQFNSDSIQKNLFHLLNLSQKIKNSTNIGNACYSLSEYYIAINNYSQALFFSNESIRYAKLDKNDYLLKKCYVMKAHALLLNDSINQSLNLLNTIRKDIETDEQQLISRKLMYATYSQIFKQQKNYQKALTFHELFKSTSDTINTKNFTTELKILENDYESEMNEKVIAELKRKEELYLLRDNQNKTTIYVLSGFSLLILITLLLLFKTHHQSIASKNNLEMSNQIISHKKEEIEKSIEYARGIQNGILPKIDELKQLFPENFIFYLPRDIVSGDFYWYQDVDGIYLIAAADCTGHGVPGALMSVVAINKLNQAVFEQNLTEPGQILASINQSIKTALKQKDTPNEHKDGLDIALLKYNPANNTLSYAGANRPLILIRNQTLNEFKPTKAAIAGHSPDSQVYQQANIQLFPGDLLFIYSDGYADQFGGPEGKKLMSKALKNIILTNSHSNMKTIEHEIRRYFNEWKSHYEQVDDVLIIGLKV